MAPREPKSSEDDEIVEKMYVSRRKGSHLTNSQKKPGQLSPLTRDESDGLGQVTLSPILDDQNDSEADFEPVVIYVHDQRLEGQSWLADLASEVLGMLVEKGIEVATPHARRIWDEKAAPALRSKMDQVARSRSRHQRSRVDEVPAAVEPGDGEPSEELTTVLDKTRVKMSRSEAQTRYLMALAARQFSDEQLRLVVDADICENEGFLELQRALAKLPPAEVTKMLEQLEADPSMLTGDTPAGLEVILGVECQDPETI